MIKKEIRALFKTKRLKLSTKELNIFNDLILIHFQKIIFPPLSYTLSFIAIEEYKEVNTQPIESYLDFKNLNNRITYPVCNFETNEMVATYPNDNLEFEKTKYNTIEPVAGDAIDAQEIDLVIVPLLAFDKTGCRVGYGKGFYDKFFVKTRPDCIKVGLSLFDPVDTIADKNEFDVPLNYCVTPNKIYEF